MLYRDRIQQSQQQQQQRDADIAGYAAIPADTSGKRQDGGVEAKPGVKYGEIQKKNPEPLYSNVIKKKDSNKGAAGGAVSYSELQKQDANSEKVEPSAPPDGHYQNLPL